MTVLLHFLSETPPCSVLTHTLVRGKTCSSRQRGVLLLCTALVNFTMQLQQVKAQLPEVYIQIWCPPGLECLEVGTAEVASGAGRTATATGACTEPVQNRKAHPTSLLAFIAIILRPVILDPFHVSDVKRHLKPVISTGLI